MYNATTQAQEIGNRSILLCLCLCLRCCVVRVNRNDVSINTNASTRRLCLRRTGLHVGFLCLWLCLCRTCKPGLMAFMYSVNDVMVFNTMHSAKAFCGIYKVRLRQYQSPSFPAKETHATVTLKSTFTRVGKSKRWSL